MKDEIYARLNPIRTADYLNGRFHGNATAKVVGDELVVTIEGLNINPQVRESALANPNFTKQRDQLGTELAEGRIIPKGQYSSLEPRQQIESESMGRVHRVENLLLDGVLKVRQRKDLTAFDVKDDPEHPGKAIATVTVKNELLQDIDVVQDRQRLVPNSGMGGVARSA